MVNTLAKSSQVRNNKRLGMCKNPPAKKGPTCAWACPPLFFSFSPRSLFRRGSHGAHLSSLSQPVHFSVPPQGDIGSRQWRFGGGEGKNCGRAKKRKEGGSMKTQSLKDGFTGQ